MTYKKSFNELLGVLCALALVFASACDVEEYIGQTSGGGAAQDEGASEINGTTTMTVDDNGVADNTGILDWFIDTYEKAGTKYEQTKETLSGIQDACFLPSDVPIPTLEKIQNVTPQSSFAFNPVLSEGFGALVSGTGVLTSGYLQCQAVAVAAAEALVVSSQVAAIQTAMTEATNTASSIDTTSLTEAQIAEIENFKTSVTGVMDPAAPPTTAEEAASVAQTLANTIDTFKTYLIGQAGTVDFSTQLAALQTKKDNLTVAITNPDPALDAVTIEKMRTDLLVCMVDGFLKGVLDWFSGVTQMVSQFSLDDLAPQEGGGLAIQTTGGATDPIKYLYVSDWFNKRIVRLEATIVDGVTTFVEKDWIGYDDLGVFGLYDSLKPPGDFQEGEYFFAAIDVRQFGSDTFLYVYGRDSATGVDASTGEANPPEYFVNKIKIPAQTGDPLVVESTIMVDAGSELDPITNRDMGMTRYRRFSIDSAGDVYLQPSPNSINKYSFDLPVPDDRLVCYSTNFADYPMKNYEADINIDIVSDRYQPARVYMMDNMLVSTAEETNYNPARIIIADFMDIENTATSEPQQGTVSEIPNIYNFGGARMAIDESNKVYVAECGFVKMRKFSNGTCVGVWKVPLGAVGPGYMLVGKDSAGNKLVISSNILTNKLTIMKLPESKAEYCTTKSDVDVITMLPGFPGI